ncbi:myb family transcription factor EFM [Jatropha curcas]|nr:myb family transcription factor EFM [Jatropha curcas]
MGLEAAERCLAKDAIATKKRDFEEQQSFLDLNNPSFDQQWTNPTHHRDKRQAGLFGPMPRAEEVPMNLNLNATEEPKLKPLTQPIWRNNRRSWTPPLHAKFVMALHMLGGPEVATPKQIRDHMQIDGLTTNQVKSHLQKYRIIWRSSQYNTTE